MLLEIDGPAVTDDEKLLEDEDDVIVLKLETPLLTLDAILELPDVVVDMETDCVLNVETLLPELDARLVGADVEDVFGRIEDATLDVEIPILVVGDDVVELEVPEMTAAEEDITLALPLLKVEPLVAIEVDGEEPEVPVLTGDEVDIETLDVMETDAELD